MTCTSIELLKVKAERIIYWVWKFFRTLFPVIDTDILEQVRKKYPESWLIHFDKMLPPDKAHVLRLFKAISEDRNLTAEIREKLIMLALAHDIGKSIVRQNIFTRVIKVVIPIPNRSHPILGARLLKKLNAPSDIVRRVARHHIPAEKDKFLKLFQYYDDNV
ncbi:MAG: HD domain-containing protein [Candidatus Riflebacteria bacterium]|nr:HD domain-containing protein [Candidatus Riflebacteria bacterium]